MDSVVEKHRHFFISTATSEGACFRPNPLESAISTKKIFY